MVKEYEELKRLFKLYKEQEMKNKKRFELSDLENFLINKAGGVTTYEKIGGYRGLYHFLTREKKKGKIREIKNSPLNERHPPLKIRWQLIEEREDGWAENTVFKLSRNLNLSYFLKRSHLQTEELLKKLRNIASFLQEKEKRLWASREERSLELFADEKYLAGSEGKKLLNRLNLTLADLKAEKYSQMFVYWHQGSEEIEKVLILENHSAFITCKRALEDGYSLFNYRPDTLIYGAGKHILDSLKFLKEIADVGGVEIKYAGDLDPEGLAIYTGLRERYPGIFLKAHLNYYQQMFTQGGKVYPLQKKQQKNKQVLSEFLVELSNNDKEHLAEKLKELWSKNLRIPQEVITYEVIVEFNEEII